MRNVGDVYDGDDVCLFLEGLMCVVLGGLNERAIDGDDVAIAFKAIFVW